MANESKMDLELMVESVWLCNFVYIQWKTPSCLLVNLGYDNHEYNDRINMINGGLISGEESSIAKKVYITQISSVSTLERWQRPI